jgi:hypothetical protein
MEWQNMITTVIFVAVACVVASMIGALLAIKIQQNYIRRLHEQNQARERAQESHHQNWEQEQEKHMVDLEARLAARVQQLREEWQAWEIKDAQRIEAMERQHEATETQWRINRDIARLPRIEDTPLIKDAAHPHQHTVPDWNPPVLQGADLSGQDLSHRYIGYADLRNARLVNTNFFMSDLSGAELSGADLSGADLSGANLSGADLRGAVLTNANLHVADLHEAILVETNLLSARNVTTQQIYTAHYDSTTQLDPSINITMPRMRSIQLAQLTQKTQQVQQERAVQPIQPVQATPSDEAGSEPLEEPVQPPPSDETGDIPGEEPIELSLSPASPPSEKPTFMEALETPRPTLLSDIELLMPLEEEVQLSTPLALSDSLLDLKVTDLLLDKQENKHTEESGTTIPR